MALNLKLTYKINDRFSATTVRQAASDMKP